MGLAVGFQGFVFPAAGGIQRREIGEALQRLKVLTAEGGHSEGGGIRGKFPVAQGHVPVDGAVGELFLNVQIVRQGDVLPTQVQRLTVF